MKNKKRLVGGAFAVAGLMAWPVVARRVEMNRRVAGKQLWIARFQQSKQWQERAKVFDSHKATAAAVFAGATQVESFRLAFVGSEPSLGQINNSSYFARGVTQNARFAARLGSIVLNAKTYMMPGSSTTQCYFEPGVAFRVWKGSQFVDTLICFHCSQLAVLEYDRRVPVQHLGGSLEGRFYVAGDFLARPQLVALAQEAFPGDSTMQALR